MVIFEECLSCAESGGAERDAAGRISYASCRHAGAGVEARREESAARADDTPVSAVMTTDVFAVRPDVSLEALGDLMLERGFGGVPVVDDEGRPIGMVSKTDLLDQRFLAGDTGEAMARGFQLRRGRYRAELGRGVHTEAMKYDSVAEAMTRAALTVLEKTPVAQAAALMVTRGIHRVLVVSDDGRLTGIVTSSDVMGWIARRAGQLPARA